MTVNRDEASTDPTAELLRVVTAVWFEIDQSDGSAVSTYFTDDATLTIADANFRGTSQIDALYSTRHARGPRVSRHCLTNLHTVQADTDSARTVSTLILYAEDGTPPRRSMQPVLVADVHDEFQRIDDRWQIRRRRIVPQFIPAHAALAVPTEDHPSSSSGAERKMR